MFTNIATQNGTYDSKPICIILHINFLNQQCDDDVQQNMELIYETIPASYTDYVRLVIKDLAVLHYHTNI